MDRRTKFILFVILSAVLLGLVFWFIIYPLLKPVIDEARKAQPPALQEPQSPVVNVPGRETSTGTQPGGIIGPGVVEVTPELSPDELRIIELSRAAGVLSERVESGSSANGFQNYEDATLDVSAELAAKFRTMRLDMQAAYPILGATYLTVARRLVEIPENDKVIRRDTFLVRVQIQVQIENGEVMITELRESTVTFTRSGSKWITTDYSVKPLEL